MDDKKNKPSISIVIPAYNEEKSIARVLENTIKICKEMVSKSITSSFEVLVIDDCSTDSTFEIVKKYEVKAFRHPYNIGNGAAIKKGIRESNGDYIIFMDADNQHNPEQIPRFLTEVKNGYDMVVGARDINSHANLPRSIANQIYNLLASYIAGKKVLDLTSGFRIINSTLAKQFVFLLPNSFSYPTTLTLALFNAGYSVGYIPITINKRIGKSKINLIMDGSRFILIIIKIAIFFVPLKIYLPMSIVLLFFGVIRYLTHYFKTGLFSTGALLLILTSVLILSLGLISDQMKYLRIQEK